MLERIRTYTRANPRKSLAIGIGFIIIVFLLFRLFHYASTGTVIIKTNGKENTVALVRVGEEAAAAKSVGGLRADVAPGRYVATVSNRFASSKKTIEVKARQQSVHIINLRAALLSPEYVLPFGASYVSPGSSLMFYVNLDDHLLYKIGSSGLPIPVSTEVAFSDIAWRGAGTGVGRDYRRGVLYDISNGALRLMRLPFNGKVIAYDVSPGGTLAITDGKSVYTRMPGGGFTRIFTSTGISSLGAGNVNILLGGGSGEDEDIATVIDLSGKVVARREGLPADKYVWSPDGTRLAGMDDNKATIYDSKLSPISVLPETHVAGLSWLDNQTLLYGVDRQMFSYALDDSAGTQLLSVPAGTTIGDIFPDRRRSAAYVLVSANDDSDHALLRAVLAGPRASAVNYSIGVFFPAKSPQCHFTFTNFLKPVILVDAWTNKSTCLDAAREELKADRLPLKLGIKFYSPRDD
jgi:hypothetical protein